MDSGSMNVILFHSDHRRFGHSCGHLQGDKSMNTYMYIPTYYRNTCILALTTLKMVTYEWLKRRWSLCNKITCIKPKSICWCF